MSKMRREWGVLSLCDIVLNHTAKETDWIRQHPEATYNCTNCPHLRPAFLLDQCIMKLGMDVEEGKWVQKGVPKGEVSTEQQLQTCKALLYDHYLPQANVYEFFMMDTAAVLGKFEKRVMSLDPPSIWQAEDGHEGLRLIQDTEFKRLGCTVDIDLAVK